MFPAAAQHHNTHLLPQVPVAKLHHHSKSSDITTVVQDIHWFAASRNSHKQYCLTAGSDRSVRLWNPMRMVEETEKTDKIRHQIIQPSVYNKLSNVLEIQCYTDGYAYDVKSVCVASGGSSSDVLLAACHKSVILTDLVTTQVTRRLQNFHSGTIHKVASFDQDLYVTASFDTTVALWDGRSRNVKPIQVLRDATDSVNDLLVQKMEDDHDTCFPYLCTASVDGSVRTYDWRRGVVSVDQVGSPITSMCWTTNEGATPQELAVNCLDGTIRLLDASLGGTTSSNNDNNTILLNTYAGSHQAGNYGLKVDCLANNATIVSGSEDGTVALYDLVSAKCMGKIPANLLAENNNNNNNNAKPTCTIAAHPTESSILITASYDGSTIIWSCPNDDRWETPLD